MNLSLSLSFSPSLTHALAAAPVHDQVHTTGIDIAQTASARAVLTLGKDLTFRDYAQGAYRMRGIGKGQTIQLLVTPEVRHLIRADLRKVAATSGAAKSLEAGEHDAHELPCRVAAWLQLQQLRSEIKNHP